MALNNLKHSKAINIATEVLKIEAQSIIDLIPQLGDDFEKLCDSIINDCTGRVILTGVGKSGHIAGKIAASLASTGTPAFFVHPGEASHGDLGMVTAKDFVIALSNSGETPEIMTIIPMLKRLKVKLASITGNPDSSMAKVSDFVIPVTVKKEACPLNLAPTASTTSTLAMGDAITVALLKMRGFTKQQFAMSHPGGSLGKRLLLYVHNIMHQDNDVPKVNHSVNIYQALLEMTHKSLGMTAIVNDSDEIIGIFTDGDLRRTLSEKVDIYQTSIQKVMTVNPTTVNRDMLAAELVALMQDKNINGVFVVDNQKVIGALNTLDLIRAGVF